MRHSHYILLLLIVLFGSAFALHGASEEPVSGSADTSQEMVNDSVSAKSLDEVVVTKSLTEHEGNKDIITVTDAMRKGTKDTGELLGRIPGVHYNPITTDLLYQGSGNVLILVDGVEKDPSYIKRLTTGRFDRITVTNNPTGIYSAYDAVIDLHTRDLYEGYEGVILTENSISPDGRNGKGQALCHTRNEGQFTYTRDRLNLDFYTRYRFQQLGLSSYFDKSYPLNGIYETTIPTADDTPNHNTRSSAYYANLAADYDISKEHSVSAKVSVAPSSARTAYDYMLERMDMNSGTTQILTEQRNSDIHGQMDIAGGVWYRGSIGAWNLRIDASYTDMKYRSVNNIEESSGYTLDDPRNIKARYWTARAEGGRYLTSKWYLNLSDSFITSSYNESRPQTGDELSSSSDIRNTFEGSLSWYPGSKASLSINAGLSVFRNAYEGLHSTDVTPRAGLQAMWAPSSKVLFRLDYRLFSMVPSLSILQDYGQFTDSLVYRKGDPEIKPALAHWLTLSCTLLQKVNLQVRYTHTSDDIYQYYESAAGMLPSGIQAPYTVISPVNGRGNQLNFNLSYSDWFGPHWMVSITAGMTYKGARYGESSQSRTLPSGSWYVLYQTLGNTLQAYLSGSVRHYASVSPQTNIWNVEDGYALSLSKTFFNNRLEVLAMWTLPVHFASGRYRGGVKSTSYCENFWSDNQFRSNNKLMFTLVYRFKGGDSVRRYNRQSESVDI
ncbi:MAG: outer membrane beta-barrel protein [Muribaculaceae bacterium]|nr:outer membrane beta-barrel protein [Muribaculaceae bacterium]